MASTMRIRFPWFTLYGNPGRASRAQCAVAMCAHELLHLFTDPHRPGAIGYRATVRYDIGTPPTNNTQGLSGTFKFVTVADFATLPVEDGVFILLFDSVSGSQAFSAYHGMFRGSAATNTWESVVLGEVYETDDGTKFYIQMDITEDDAYLALSGVASGGAKGKLLVNNEGIGVVYTNDDSSHVAQILLSEAAGISLFVLGGLPIKITGLGASDGDLIQIDADGTLSAVPPPTADVGVALTEVVRITAADSPYEASSGQIILIDCTDDAVLITLPASGTSMQVQVVKTDTGSNQFIASGNGDDTVDGGPNDGRPYRYSATYVIAAGETDWIITNQFIHG